MKTITTLTAIAALVAGISIASAQNQGGTAAPGASPSNINKGIDDSSRSGSQSGSESSGAAMKSGGSMNSGKSANATGNGKFCIEISKGGGKECTYASLSACETDARPSGLQCSPNAETTGSK
jgi:hypothetical protein